MSWFLVDDDFFGHPKVVRCSLRALGLWVKAGSWSKRYLTDGFIPIDIACRLKESDKAAASKLASELISAGLWLHADGGYQFHGWVAVQGSRAETLARRAADAARKAAFRAETTPLSGRTTSGVQPADAQAPSSVRPDAASVSARTKSVLSSPLLTSPDPEREREINLAPPLPTLTGSTHAYAQNTNGCGGGEDEAPLEREHKSRAQAAFGWLHAILFDTLQQVAPRPDGRWRAAYVYIGTQTAAEWLRVEACLRSELTTGRLRGRQCTPGHVADYWQAYAASEPPGGGKGRRSGPSAVGTQAEHEADALHEEPLP